MIRHRKPLIILVVLVMLGTVGVAAFALQPSAHDLLVAALETTEAIHDGHAIATFEVDAQGETGSGTVEMWGQLDMGPNGEPAFRLEVLDANLSEFIGVTAVSDGHNFWLYHPEQNKVLVGTFAEVAQRMAEMTAGKEFDFETHESDFDKEELPENATEAVDKLLEYVTAQRTGGERLEGSITQIVRLVPIPEAMPAEVRAAGGFVNVWIRSSDGAPVGIELAESAAGYGKALATTLALNEGVDEKLFTFDIPAGVEVINFADLEMPESVTPEEAAAAADMQLLSPTDLPAAATLVDTAVVRGAVVQQYSLPAGKSFTVAQGKTDADMTPDQRGEAVTVRGLTGTVYAADNNGRSLLAWTENGINYWIGGDLSPAEAVSIANSLE